MGGDSGGGMSVYTVTGEGINQSTGTLPDGAEITMPTYDADGVCTAACFFHADGILEDGMGMDPNEPFSIGLPLGYVGTDEIFFGQGDNPTGFYATFSVSGSTLSMTGYRFSENDMKYPIELEWTITIMGA